MATLAQDIVNFFGPDQRSKENLFRRLADPKMPDDIRRNFICSVDLTEQVASLLMPYPADAVAFDQDTVLKSKATKFVFTEDVPSVIEGLIRAKALSRGLIVDTARLPASRCWIEWGNKYSPEGYARCGVMLVRGWVELGERCRLFHMKDYRPDSVLAVFIMSFHDVPPMAVMGCFFSGFPLIAGETTDNIFFSMEEDGDADGMKREIMLLADLLSALFLINTPRVCFVNEIEYAPKLQRARAKAKKLPLIEYKQMKLRIGVGTPHARSRSGDSEVGAGIKRRLHSVIGHFRTREYPNRDVPVVSWVDEHYRGDPARGVVLHERQVIRP